MSIIPMTRTSMQKLKVDTEREIHTIAIQKIVQDIYFTAIKTAKTASEKSYIYKVPDLTTNKMENKFHVENMSEILNHLKGLFPECDIRHTLVARDKDGRMYDISKINNAMLPHVDKVDKNSYIIIDWV